MRSQIAIAAKFGRTFAAFVSHVLVFPLYVAQEVVRGVVAFSAAQTAKWTQFLVNQIHVTHLTVAVGEF